MLQLLKIHCVRNIANINHYKLYRDSYLGTKHLIEKFRTVLAEALNFVCDLEEKDL